MNNHVYFDFQYQRDIFNNILKGACSFKIISPRTLGRTRMQKYIVYKILENRFRSSERDKFETTKRKFSNWLIKNPLFFVCEEVEITKAITDIGGDIDFY